jgi:curved DNA-binding protein CbpA
MNNIQDFIKQYIHMDLYGILGLEENCSKKELKTRYNELVKYFHPDKPTGDASKCEQLNIAYMILSKDKYKKEYDYQKRLNDENSRGYNELKNSYTDYLGKMTNIPDYQSGVKKTKVELERELNEKHGFNPNEQYEISSEEANRRYDNLLRERAEFNIPHENIFKTKGYNPVIFNNYFNKLKEQEVDTRIMTYDDVSAISVISNYADFNTDNLYTESQDGNIFGVNSAPINEAFKITKTVESNLFEGINIEVDDYKSHNKVDRDYGSMLEERMKDYKLQTNRFGSRTRDQYDNNFGKFGILNNLENSMRPQLQNKSMKRTDTDDRLQRLLNERKI